jgi:lysine-N-methylase
MPSPLVQLPLIQNWSCHSCGGCCRKHLIEITEEDRQKIVEQKWTAADGVDIPPVVWHAGPPWKKRYRLTHRADGSCVFLDEKGLCRIHAKFGEPAKPLACQVYPYALHPGGRKLALSLRFSCPSVVANKGRPVSLQVRELKRIADLTVPPTADQIPPPEIAPRVRVEWSDFHRFVNALDNTLAEPGVDLLTRLLRATFWVRLVGQSKFETVKGNRLDEYLHIVTEAAKTGIGELPMVRREPSRAGRLQFRMLAAQYSRIDTFEKKARSFGGRVRLLRAAVRFARGQGNVPPLHPGFNAVPFSQLETSFGGLSPETDAMLTRYFRVKIQGLHFCGLAYYRVPFVEGFYSLALIFPVVMWQARWLAASESRDKLATDDIARVISITDHHHGYSPVLGTRSSRRRVRLLTHHDDLERLCCWYAR